MRVLKRDFDRSGGRIVLFALLFLDILGMEWRVAWRLLYGKGSESIKRGHS